jgi:hypothetical protein
MYTFIEDGSIVAVHHKLKLNSFNSGCVSGFLGFNQISASVLSVLLRKTSFLSCVVGETVIALLSNIIIGDIFLDRGHTT